MAAGLALLLLLAPLLVDDAHGAVAFKDVADRGAPGFPASLLREAAACVCAPKHAACKSDGKINPDQYGDVEEWDTSKLTNFYQAFYNPFRAGGMLGFDGVNLPNNFVDSKGNQDLENIGRFCGTFDADIGGWDTAAATTLESMFEGATQFNADIGRWDVSQVEDIRWIFKDASAFNANLASWQVSEVIEVAGAFKSAIAFDQNLAGWDVRKFINYNEAFTTAMSFTQDLLPWVERIPKPEANDYGNIHPGEAAALDPKYAGITMLKQAYAPKHDLALRPEVLPGQTVRACASVPTAARAHTSHPAFVLATGAHGATVRPLCAARRAAGARRVGPTQAHAHPHEPVPRLAPLSCCPPAAVAAGGQRNAVP